MAEALANPQKEVILKTYVSLRSAVRKALALGKERTFRAVEREKVRTAWEIGIREGVRVREFLKSRLPREHPFIVKTVKSDKYDRYLADVFLPKTGKRKRSSGSKQNLKNPDWVYLNQELIKKGHASIVP